MGSGYSCVVIYLSVDACPGVKNDLRLGLDGDLTAGLRQIPHKQVAGPGAGMFYTMIVSARLLAKITVFTRCWCPVIGTIKFHV